jgi:hypothetical protein
MRGTGAEMIFATLWRRGGRVAFLRHGDFASRCGFKPLAGRNLAISCRVETSRKGAGCAKTPARVHADLFCSLFQALRTFRSKKIAKNFALLGQPQKIAVFSHSLGGKRPYKGRLEKDRSRAEATFQRQTGAPYRIRMRIGMKDRRPIGTMHDRCAEAVIV